MGYSLYRKRQSQRIPPVFQEDYSELTDHIGEEFASVWVYRDGNTDTKENYEICVDTYILAQSRERLDQLFA
ncbi:MAG: hypothetical protein SOW51_08755 [Oscillospiraceae bacterium]|nr:hypothetical protein [Oscillospiraceae bacterium]